MANGDAPATPLDAERARLREAGYTEKEISDYLLERLYRASQQAPATGGAPAFGLVICCGIAGTPSVNAPRQAAIIRRCMIVIYFTAIASTPKPASMEGSPSNSNVVSAGARKKSPRSFRTWAARPCESG